MEDNSSTASESQILNEDEDDNRSVCSIDSSFYGSNSVKELYEAKARKQDGSDFWRLHAWNIQVIAARAVRQHPERWLNTTKKRRREDAEDDSDSRTIAKKTKAENQKSSDEAPASSRLPSMPHNPYQGSENALQINESVEDFINRQPPSSARTDQPWIWCAYFYANRQSIRENIPVFKQVGCKLLEDFSLKRHRLEQSFDPPKRAAAITRMMVPDRINLEKNIVSEAKKNGITTGKWMLFPTVDKVDEYWSVVVRATIDGRLGIAAKVATKPDKADDPSRVICVYTKDFEDKADIKRVLVEIVRLELAKPVSGPIPKGRNVGDQIWYKPDCYTYLDLMSGNEYNIRPTMYSTSSLLTQDDIANI